jgi:hypothetical protein
MYTVTRSCDEHSRTPRWRADGGSGVSAPRVVIVLEFEAPPRVISICKNEGDQHRLADWLQAHPELEEMVRRAFELDRAERPLEEAA